MQTKFWLMQVKTKSKMTNLAQNFEEGEAIVEGTVYT